MAAFKYKARSRTSGKMTEGVIEVADQQAGIAALREKGLIVQSIVPARTGRGKLSGDRKKRGRNVGLEDLVIFSRQLAVIVNAGLPIIEGLNILGEQMENAAFRTVIQQIERDVEGGDTLSDAMAKHPRVFNALFVNLIRAGEASGMLDVILVQLAVYMEKAASLQRKVKGATIYPTIVITVAVIVVSILMTVVIPVFENIFANFNADLPAPTQILCNISRWIRHYWYLILGGLAGGGFAFFRYIRTPAGRKQFDATLLKMPIFGLLFRKVAVAKFSRTFGVLLRSGVNILVALEIVAKTAGNKIVEEAIDKVRLSIREGDTIAGPLRESGVFPPMVVRMVDVGERSGALDEMLTKIADFYEEQVDVAVDSLTQMLEPVMIVFLGVVVGGIVISMFMPLFNIADVVSK